MRLITRDRPSIRLIDNPIKGRGLFHSVFPLIIPKRAPLMRPRSGDPTGLAANGYSTSNRLFVLPIMATAVEGSAERMAAITRCPTVIIDVALCRTVVLVNLPRGRLLKIGTHGFAARTACSVCFWANILGLKFTVYTVSAFLM